MRFFKKLNLFLRILDMLIWFGGSILEQKNDCPQLYQVDMTILVCILVINRSNQRFVKLAYT
jgi:hypothetical protein